MHIEHVPLIVKVAHWISPPAVRTMGPTQIDWGFGFRVVNFDHFIYPRTGDRG